MERLTVMKQRSNDNLSIIEFVVSKYNDAHCVMLQHGGYVIESNDKYLSNLSTETEQEAWQRAANNIRRKG